MRIHNNHTYSILLCSLVALNIIAFYFSTVSQQVYAIGNNLYPPTASQNGWTNSNNTSVLTASQENIHFKSKGYYGKTQISLDISNLETNLIRFSVLIKRESSGSKDDNSKQLDSVFGINAQNQSGKIPLLVNVDRSKNTEMVDRLLVVPKYSDDLVLYLTSKNQNSIQLSNINIVPSQHFRSYLYFKNSYAAIWTVLLFYLFLLVTSRASINQRICFFVIIIAVSVGITIDRNILNLGTNWIVNYIFSSDFNYEKEFIYKIGHFLGFFFLTLIIMHRCGRTKFTNFQCVVLVISLAASSEINQLHVYSRSASWLDFFIDLSAILLVSVCVHFKCNPITSH